MTWKYEDPTGPFDFSRIVGMDPYASWVLNWGWTEFNRRDPDVVVPFVVAILAEETARILETNQVRHEESDPKFLPILIPLVNPPIQVGSYISAFARRQFFLDSVTNTDDRYAQFRVAPKQIKLGLPLKAKQQQDLKICGSGASLDRVPQVDFSHDPMQPVVIGVIDDGIGFAHDRFRSSPTTTRIAYFWQQDGEFMGGSSTVTYGREIAATNGTSGSPGINALLSQCSPGGIADEDSIYAQFGGINFLDPDDHKPIAQRYAHGTHVLDLAAGSAPGRPQAGLPIIAVQLPVACTADTSGTTLEFYVKDAFDYIINRAKLLTQPGQPLLPIVINHSYGVTAGPHDGTGMVEQDIEALVAGKTGNLTFVLPAGNAQLSRDHARVCWNGKAGNPQHDPAMLPWRVLPNGLTVSQLEIWLPTRESGVGDRVQITVTPPGGTESTRLGETDGAAAILYDTDGVTAIAVASYSLVGPPTNRGLFLISLRPTEHLRPTPAICGNEPDAPAGIWEIRIYKGPAYDAEDVEAWIQRNDTPFGYPIRGRQSYFDDCGYVRYDPISGRPLDEDPATSVCHVKRVSLINAIATSCSPVVVGGVFRDVPGPAEYSGGGPTWTYCTGGAQRMGPDVSAVSDDSHIHRGVLGAGSRSGSAFALSGTSVSTPQVARVAARLAGAPGAGAIGRGDLDHVAIGYENANPGWPTLQPSREGEGRIIVPSDRPRRIE
jgi:Subtilase family